MVAIWTAMVRYHVCLTGVELTGADYTLIWDERFVNNLREYEPMDYTAPPPIRVERVTQAHLNEVRYCAPHRRGLTQNRTSVNTF